MERFDDCWDGREDFEVFHQRMQRRRKAKAAVRAWMPDMLKGAEQ